LWLHAHFRNGCILVAHNGKRFDFPILKRYLQLTSKTYDELYGIDSREIFKAHFPDLIKNKMEHLVDEFLPPRKYKHHDALVDAQNLSSVIKTASQKKGIELRDFLRVREKDIYVMK
jgi:DNA polymerase III epsilon subunit-like protein